MSKKERLDKILSNLGFGSRKDIKEKVKRGSVEIDGIIVTDPSAKIDPEASEIKLGNKIVDYKKYIYIMLNKPKGLVSSTDDPVSNTVLDILEPRFKAIGLFPVGRLDKDTEGLLILSNDGQLAHQLLSPKKHVDKTYYAEVNGFVDEKDIKDFKLGVVLEDDYKTMPAKLEIIEAGEISKIMLTIKEGKFHQVKRMFKAQGKEVLYLKRISMGKLGLDKRLLRGQYRELDETEIELLRES